MNPNIKNTILRFLFAGLYFALFLYALDWSQGKPFQVTTFLFRLLIFGGGLILVRKATKYITSKISKRNPV